MLDSIVRRGARLLVPFAFAAVALAACSESPTESGRFVRITTDRAEYQAGSSGMATVTNVSDLPVLYNLCEREVQRRTPAGWVAVSRDSGDEGFVCIGVLLTLQPGASTGAGFMLRSDLPAGTYRVRFPGFYAREGDASASAETTLPFRVTPGFVLH